MHKLRSCEWLHRRKCARAHAWCAKNGGETYGIITFMNCIPIHVSALLHLIFNPKHKPIEFSDETK